MKFKIALLAIILTSCVTERKRRKICATCPQTSVITNEVVKRDTFIYLTQKGAEISFKSDCPDIPLTERKENGIKASIYKDNTGFKFKCEADSLKAVITLLEARKQEVITKTVYLPCDKNEVKWYHIMSLWYTVITAGYYLIRKKLFMF